jgi:hypothetical protein
MCANRIASRFLALTAGVVVGELVAVAMFSGPVDRVLADQAAHRADATPAVVQASGRLDQARAARTSLDVAVAQASQRRDEALVVARCEYHPTPGCPQTHITGVPGTGPETRTADDFLGDAQRELDTAAAERDRRAPTLDSQIADDERALTQARERTLADADSGLGARWVAMNDYTLHTPGALALRLLTIAFFALLSMLPFALRRRKDERDERANLEADTAIAVKRAEVRASIETMWAEQELASARLAVEAQNEIDREHHRRRVAEALGGPLQVSSQRVEEPAPAIETTSEPDNLPAVVSPAEPQDSSLIPDIAKAASRWIRPFVPPILASAIETTTKPLRGARQVSEETEELHFSLRRTHRVSVETVETEENAEPVEQPRQHVSTIRGGRPELRGTDGPRQLPPAE